MTSIRFNPELTQAFKEPSIADCTIIYYTSLLLLNRMVIQRERMTQVISSVTQENHERTDWWATEEKEGREPVVGTTYKMLQIFSRQKTGKRFEIVRDNRLKEVESRRRTRKCNKSNSWLIDLESNEPTTDIWDSIKENYVYILTAFGFISTTLQNQLTASNYRYLLCVCKREEGGLFIETSEQRALVPRINFYWFYCSAKRLLKALPQLRSVYTLLFNTILSNPFCVCPPSPIGHEHVLISTVARNCLSLFSPIILFVLSIQNVWKINEPFECRIDHT